MWVTRVLVNHLSGGWFTKLSIEWEVVTYRFCLIVSHYHTEEGDQLDTTGSSFFEMQATGLFQGPHDHSLCSPLQTVGRAL